MVNMEVSIVINRPVGEVFASLADLEKNVMWRSGTVEATKTSTGPIGVWHDLSNGQQSLRPADAKRCGGY